MAVHGSAAPRFASAWAAPAFGLMLRADFDMPGLPADESGERTGRRCELLLCSDPSVEGDWVSNGVERMFELADDVGLPVCTVDVRDGAGARLWGRERGSFFVDNDGSRVRCYPSTALDWQWRRFLVGQVLPFTALVHGYEILHGSAVAIRGKGVAFAGPSGVGKSSVAAQLVLRGAALIADDVVSLERRERDVIAHRGTPMIGLRHEERLLWSKAELEALGAPIAENGSELLVSVSRSTSSPTPLRVLYLLSRSRLQADLTFEPVPDARYLLASTFNNVLKTRDRLVRMLDVYSAVSRAASVFRVNVPSSATAADVATAVQAHLQPVSRSTRGVAAR